jgi:hypothetical protein
MWPFSKVQLWKRPTPSESEDEKANGMTSYPGVGLVSHNATKRSRLEPSIVQGTKSHRSNVNTNR